MLKQRTLSEYCATQRCTMVVSPYDPETCLLLHVHCCVGNVKSRRRIREESASTHRTPSGPEPGCCRVCTCCRLGRQLPASHSWPSSHHYCKRSQPHSSQHANSVPLMMSCNHCNLTRMMELRTQNDDIRQGAIKRQSCQG